MIKKKFSDALQFVKERYVAKKIRKIVGSGEQGFTLLEILVVLTIMGFLIAMVAPRLAGISGDAVDKVCDSNQNRMGTYMGAYYEKTARFPNNLTNIVEEVTADATYQIPAVSDDDPENGAETLAREFNDRNHFRIHYLDNDEAAELKKMGIVSVFNLNDYSAYVEDGTAIKADYDNTAGTNNDFALATTVAKQPKMKKKTISTDTSTHPLAVAMIGIGVRTNAGNFEALPGERGWGEPDHFGRIVLGMGPESSLVKDGVISNAAHCPGGIQNADNATYNDYNLILPRLEATSKRIADATVGATVLDADYDSATEGVQVRAVCYDDAPVASYDMIGNADHLKFRTVTISDAQAGHQYATQCPEGHMYPEDDGEFWGVDFGAAAAAATLD